MRGKIFENVTMLTQMILPGIIKPGYKCIDATTGNGHDTLYLSDQVGSHGFVYGFDIQALAIESTRQRLGDRSNVRLICDGHEKMADYVKEKIDFVIFNLGYLPRADKSIKTHKTTTILAIEVALNLLKCHGILWVVVYPGHEEGAEESLALNEFFSQLDQKDYSVMVSKFINQKNNPPYVIAVEKKI